MFAGWLFIGLVGKFLFNRIAHLVSQLCSVCWNGIINVDSGTSLKYPFILVLVCYFSSFIKLFKKSFIGFLTFKFFTRTLMKMVFHLHDLFKVENLLYFLIFVGIYASVLYLIDNLKSVILIAKSVLDPYFQPQSKIGLAERYGSWAVVTGSTDGIGREYAKELAKKGINIVLISRTKEKLIKAAYEIELAFNVKTKWIVADFSKGKEVYKHIENELAGIPVGILVNNVGKMYDYPEELGKVPEEIIWDLININCAACTIMSRMLIQQMKENGKGAIVNISSGSELQPLPYMAVYAASKTYVKSLTIAMQHELAPYNITVQLVTPLYLVTKMNEYSKIVMKGGFLFPHVKTFTESTVYTLGRTNETTGYWTHGLQYAVMKLVPTWFRTWIGSKMIAKMRDEYLANCEKSQ